MTEPHDEPVVLDWNTAPDKFRAAYEQLQQQAEPGPGARALREALERAQQREAEAQEEAARVTPLEQENARLRRTLGVVRAGVDPDSTFGKGVLATAAASGIDSPADVSALARVMVAEARGELPTTNGQESHARDH